MMQRVVGRDVVTSGCAYGDKAGYLRGYDYAELLAPEYKTTFFILRSSPFPLSRRPLLPLMKRGRFRTPR